MVKLSLGLCAEINAHLFGKDPLQMNYVSTRGTTAILSNFQRVDTYLFSTFSFDDDQKLNFVGVFLNSCSSQNLLLIFRFSDIFINIFSIIWKICKYFSYLQLTYLFKNMYIFSKYFKDTNRNFSAQDYKKSKALQYIQK